MSLIEIAASSTYATSVWMAARNNVHTWWIGIIGCLLYGWVFFSVQLYADVTLQLFFIVSSIVGWVNWLSGNKGKAIHVRKTPIWVIAAFALAALCVSSCYAYLLHTFTDAWSPWVDSLVMTFSIMAQFMLMGRRLENWYVWLLVNTIAIPLYASRELYLTAGLYLIFWCNAWYGLYQWRREMKTL
ncbi:nicotinamide riboside transporter PnuC [Serratia sp. UGAL515B_01]|uniref:nicotinamide riboside transporter PnuC n=1 Tax=Serratia sp. UGAL515B_01 TaxID=2986763 RepID=UPI00295483C0|nr:nicotinamide riboside transporter PnuC [Serratia sp. UGAL515B_01]WON77444.1 nicotinamide riboside transporter PnuC [Serratia sp. UGAL515B_01]